LGYASLDVKVTRIVNYESRLMILPSLFIITVPSDLDDLSFYKLLSSLPEERVDRIRKFHFRRNALQSLCGELISRIKIAEYLGIDRATVAIQRDEFGKPHCVNSNHLFFNVAHSGNLVAAAFDSKVVGVDIENMRNTDLAIADRFFTKNEAALLRAKPQADQRDFFFKLWTLKESFIKAEGKGLSIPLNSFEFDIDNLGNVYFADLSGARSRTYTFRHYETQPGYNCALCSESGNQPKDIIRLEFDDLSTL
jgi:4'-phosphopantetheinyl transferase